MTIYNMTTNDRVHALSHEIIEIIDECRNKGLLIEPFIDNFISRANTELPLKIAVIGKMKAGKSTLINSLIFKNNVLPADVQPLTAVLTQISYNEVDSTSIHVDFFTEEDVQDMVLSSEENIKNQLVKLYTIPNWKSLLGLKNIEINIDNLSEYTAADGMFSSIVKQVDIKYHHSSLKGICIVDTPGFNDPVKSRVEATNIAIQNCQIILYVHGPNSHYDVEEKEMLFSQIGFSQTSKLIDVITRIDDIPLGEWEATIERLNNAKSTIISDIDPNSENKHIIHLLEESPTIYVCAPMALIGYRLENGETLSRKEQDLRLDFNREFNLFSSKDLIESSNLGALCGLINNLANQKNKFIASSFPNELRGELLRTIEECKICIEADESLKTKLSSDADTFREQIDKVELIQDELIKSFKLNTLHTSLCLKIEEIQDKLIKERDKRTNEEFLEDNYRPENFFSTGKLDNHSRYSAFVRHFTCDTRTELVHFKNEIRNTIKAHIRLSLDKALTLLHIDQDQVAYYTTPLYSYCDEKTASINTNVESHSLSERLKGNPQHVKYYSKFEEIFTDEYIGNLLISFKYVSESFKWENGSEFNIIVEKVTDSVIKKFKAVIKDPQIKLDELIDCNNRITNNKTKIIAINDILKKNESIFKN